MKRMNTHLILLVTALLLVSTTAFSQEPATAEPEPETSSIIYDGSVYGFDFAWKRKSRMSIHLPELSFAFANLEGLSDQPHADLKEPRSYSIGIGLGSYTVGLSEHWALGAGLRLDFTRYHFKGNVGLRETRDYDIAGEPIGKSYYDFLPDPEGREYKSSKLIAYYIAVPLVLEYQVNISNKHNPFFINAGVEGLIRYYSKSQVDVKVPGKVTKESLGDANIPLVNARLIVNVGFDSVGFTAYYQPHSLFKNNRGPDLYPWGVGLAVWI